MYSNVAQLISFKLQFFVNWGYHSMVASWGPGGAKLDPFVWVTILQKLLCLSYLREKIYFTVLSKVEVVAVFRGCFFKKS